MASYAKIKNKKLVKLLKESVSLKGMKDKERQDLLDQIASMPKERTENLISVLQQEKTDYDFLTNAAEKNYNHLKERYQKLLDELTDLEANAKKSIQEANERISKKEDEKKEKDLLNQLDNI